jgi:predicted dehydrogenase
MCIPTSRIHLNLMTARLGMVGCGLIANAHGLAAQRSGADVQFVACSSLSLSSAQSFADEFSCPAAYDDHSQLLQNEILDGVVIATPPAAHLQIILDCLDAGIKHILCEKPLTLTGDEAHTVTQAAQKAGATLLEGFMYRHHPQIQRSLDIIRSGELGEVDHFSSSITMLDPSETGKEDMPPNWRRDADQGGVLHDFLCYPIDAANLFIDSEPVKAFAHTFTSPHHGTVYRIYGMIEYADGAMATINASRLADFNQPLSIACANGTLSLDVAYNPVGYTNIRIRRSSEMIATEEQLIPVKTPESKSTRLLDLPVFTTQLEHFVEIIRGTRKALVTTRESLRNARVRDALIKSASSGQWTTVNLS